MCERERHPFYKLCVRELGFKGHWKEETEPGLSCMVPPSATEAACIPDHAPEKSTPLCAKGIHSLSLKFRDWWPPEETWKGLCVVAPLSHYQRVLYRDDVGTPCPGGRSQWVGACTHRHSLILTL